VVRSLSWRGPQDVSNSYAVVSYSHAVMPVRLLMLRFRSNAETRATYVYKFVLINVPLNNVPKRQGLLGHARRVSGDVLWLHRKRETQTAVLLTVMPEFTTETEPVRSFFSGMASGTTDLLPCESYERLVSNAPWHSTSGALQAERLNTRGARLFIGGAAFFDVVFFPLRMGVRDRFESLACVGPRWRSPFT